MGIWFRWVCFVGCACCSHCFFNLVLLAGREEMGGAGSSSLFYISIVIRGKYGEFGLYLESTNVDGVARCCIEMMVFDWRMFESAMMVMG